MTSLTELCNICYANPPKYTCPRCGLQSCSLECVRTHKKRAKCSGVRDPTAYKRASELATPSSIDQDFNFITKVQRDIDKADKDVAGRGITLSPTKNERSSLLGNSKLENEYEACGVTVIKAPAGLTRSKQNHTHWDKKQKCIRWTVEWVLQDDSRVLANIRGTRNILEALANTVGKSSLIRKRKFDSYQGTAPSNAKEQSWEQINLESLQSRSQQASEEAIYDDPEVKSRIEQKEMIVTKKHTENTNTEETNRAGSTGEISQTYFYLHRPRTSSKWTCLIPIPASSVISDVLKDRTIVEFPTVYALPEAPDQLQPPFITSDKYEELCAIEVAPVLPQYDQEDVVSVVDTLPEHIDEKRVMEVLKKDLVS